MEKQALLGSYNINELLLGSALAGGGTFAAYRLLKDIMEQARNEGKPEEVRPNELSIDIPRTHASANPMMRKAAAGTIETLAALGGGAAGGFMGTKLLYDMWRKKQMQHEINKAEENYLKTLSQVSKAASEETPKIDEFCEKMAEYVNVELEKKALNLTSLLKALKGAGAKAMGPINKGVDFVKAHPAAVGLPAIIGSDYALRGRYPVSVNDQNIGITNAAINDTARSAAGGDALWKTWGAAGSGMALLTLGAMLHSHNSKLKKEDKIPPSGVAINYV